MSKRMNEKTVIGIDFGGTKIKFGVVTSAQKITGDTLTLPTRSERSANEILHTMIEGIEQIVMQSGLRTNEIDGIGIGSPGPLDLKRGIILDPPNLPTLHNFPLKARLESHFNLPVEINNDGNCFVLGEAVFGVGKDFSIVCGVTLGTGFGCGIVFDQKIYAGATGTAAEVWCTPYTDSSFEEYGSARNVVRIYQRITRQTLDAKAIYNLAQQGEPNALVTFSEYGQHLGKILSVLVNILDPDIVVIGGSVSNAWEFFQSSLIEQLHKYINKGPREHVTVQQASLGDDAGLLGAAALLFS